MMNVKLKHTFTFIILYFTFNIYGTGSYPCPPQGWHLLTLFRVSHNPFSGPYFLNASMP